ncbi:MAG: ribosome maturation factor RimM [Lachnospiraceae bacterium]|nr:ribosome maturation factor RimM [Lachnospiraceae bacterium]
MTDLKDYFRIGVITSPHGVHGEVNVFPTTDDVKRFSALKEVLMVGPRDERVLHVEGVKYFKNMVILKFKEFTTMNETELLRQRDLYVDRAHAVKLEEGEYFISDIIGLNVVTDEGADLGVITDVLQTGANDVYAVKMKNGREVLLPVIDECILDISLEEKKVLVHVMKGLLED